MSSAHIEKCPSIRMQKKKNQHADMCNTKGHSATVRGGNREREKGKQRQTRKTSLSVDFAGAHMCAGV